MVIVSLNCLPALRRCLRAVEASRHREQIETFVVDCGSQDGCQQIDAEFSWATMLRLPRNFGLTRARNIAARTASGELVFFLSPDVEVEPGTIAALAKAIDACSDVYAAVPLFQNPEGKPVPAAHRLPRREDLLAACKENRGLIAIPAGERVEAFSDAAWMIRRQFLAGLNFLEEKRYSQFWAELEISDQIRSVGKKITAVQEARATLHPPALVALETADRTLLASDRVQGAAAYLGKRGGLGAELGFRITMILYALVRVITFKETGYSFHLLLDLISGVRVDGTQSGTLG